MNFFVYFISKSSKKVTDSEFLKRILDENCLKIQKFFVKKASFHNLNFDHLQKNL